MKPLLTIFALLTATTAYADMPTILFGQNNLSSPLTPNQPLTVAGPLVQLQMADGTILSLQQGSHFRLDSTGAVTFLSGNLRLGPSGNLPLPITLPTGPATIAPLTALTLTANNTETTGRIYHGSATLQGRIFSNGEGFRLTPSGPHGTFTPAPAQSPAYTNLAQIEPAAGPAPALTPPTPATHTDLTIRQPRTPATTAQQPTQTPPVETPPAENPPATSQPPQTDPTQPTDTPPTNDQPTQNPPADNPPVDNPPADTPPTGTPQQSEQTPPADTPPPAETTQPDQPSQPEQEAPAPEVPTTKPQSGLYGAWSSTLGVAQPNGTDAIPGTFTMAQYADGTEQLEATKATYLRTNISILQRGTASQMDVASDASTAGLGRWVGGQLTSISGATAHPVATTFDNSTNTLNPDGTTTAYTNSLHYIWGEKPTAIPTSGHINYTLFAATQPTYTVQAGAATPPSQGGTFAGNLSIDFAPTFGGKVGSYNLNGTVTMPETTQTASGPTTSNVTYRISTPQNGVPLSGDTFSAGPLTVSAPTGALACPSGCTGTVNAAGFGAGVKDVGTIYAINPTGPVGIAGSAIFTTPK